MSWKRAALRGLGIVYALCALFAAFGVGCTTQSSAITEAVNTIAPVSPHIIGHSGSIYRRPGHSGRRQIHRQILYPHGSGSGLLLYCLLSVSACPEQGFPALRNIADCKAAPSGQKRPLAVLSEARCKAPPASALPGDCSPMKPASAPQPLPPLPRNQGSQKTKPDFHDGGFLGYCRVIVRLRGWLSSPTFRKPASIRGFGSANLTSAAFTYLPFGGAPPLVPGSGGLRHYHPSSADWLLRGRAVEYCSGRQGYSPIICAIWS